MTFRPELRRQYPVEEHVAQPAAAGVNRFFRVEVLVAEVQQQLYRGDLGDELFLEGRSVHGSLA